MTIFGHNYESSIEAEPPAANRRHQKSRPSRTYRTSLPTFNFLFLHNFSYEAYLVNRHKIVRLFSLFKKNLAKIAGQHFEFHDVFYLIPLESQSFLLYLRSFWLSSIEEQFFTAFSIKPVRGHRNRIQSLWRNKCETFNSWLLGFLNKSQC